MLYKHEVSMVCIKEGHIKKAIYVVPDGHTAMARARLDYPEHEVVGASRVFDDSTLHTA